MAADPKPQPAAPPQPANEPPPAWRDFYTDACNGLRGGWPALFRRLDEMARRLNHAATCPIPERTHQREASKNALPSTPNRVASL
jgi:hypothetical protein